MGRFKIISSFMRHIWNSVDFSSHPRIFCIGREFIFFSLQHIPIRILLFSLSMIGSSVFVSVRGGSFIWKVPSDSRPEMLLFLSEKCRYVKTLACGLELALLNSLALFVFGRVIFCASIFSCFLLRFMQLFLLGFI